MADTLHKYRCVIEEEKTDMARPRRQFEGSLSPGQAHYVLDRLIKDRRVSATEIDRYVSEMGREITDLEARLARLRDAAGPAAAAAVAGLAAGVAGAAAVRRGRKPGRPGRPPGRPGRPPGRRGRPPASASASAEGGAAPAKRGRKARTAITPEQLASRQLQGRYLALVRRFPANKRPQYAKIAKDKGREAAIREMQDAVKK
jgi:hypothetical protein